MERKTALIPWVGLATLFIDWTSEVEKGFVRGPKLN